MTGEPCYFWSGNFWLPSNHTEKEAVNRRCWQCCPWRHPSSGHRIKSFISMGNKHQPQCPCSGPASDKAKCLASVKAIPDFPGLASGNLLAFDGFSEEEPRLWKLELMGHISYLVSHEHTCKSRLAFLSWELSSGPTVAFKMKPKFCLPWNTRVSY